MVGKFSFNFSLFLILIACLCRCDIKTTEPPVAVRPQPIFSGNYQPLGSPDTFQVKVEWSGLGTGTDDLELRRTKKRIHDLALHSEDPIFEVVARTNSPESSYVDRDVEPRSIYLYRLIDRETGVSFGPIEVEVPEDLTLTSGELPWIVDLRRKYHRVTIGKGVKVRVRTAWAEIFIDELIAEPGSEIIVGTGPGYSLNAKGLPYCSGLSVIAKRMEGALNLRLPPQPCEIRPWEYEQYEFPKFDVNRPPSALDLIEVPAAGPRAGSDGLLFIIETEGDYSVNAEVPENSYYACIREGKRRKLWSSQCDREESWTRLEGKRFEKAQRPGAPLG